MKKRLIPFILALSLLIGTAMPVAAASLKCPKCGGTASSTTYTEGSPSSSYTVNCTHGKSGNKDLYYRYNRYRWVMHSSCGYDVKTYIGTTSKFQSCGKNYGDEEFV